MPSNPRNIDDNDRVRGADAINRDEQDARRERGRDASPVQTPGIHGETAPASHHEQHTRKGQAQSPRELTHNEPPKKKEGHR